MKMTVNDVEIGKNGKRVPEDLKHMVSQILLFISGNTSTTAHHLIESIGVEFKTATEEKSWMVFHITMRLPHRYQFNASWEWDRRHAIALNKKIFLQTEAQDGIQDALADVLAHYQDKCVIIKGNLFDPASVAKALISAISLFLISRQNMLRNEQELLEHGERNFGILANLD